MVSWILRLLLVALVVRVIVSAVSGLLRPKGASEPMGDRGKRTALVRDPVCGTYVEPSHAVSTRAGSTVHYFCSESCRQAFGRG